MSAKLTMEQRAVLQRQTEAAEALEAALRFKEFVHSYLDSHGVPHGDPENQHQKEGCRIGARLDLLFAEREAACRDAKFNYEVGVGLANDVASMEAERDAARADAAALRAALTHQVAQVRLNCVRLTGSKIYGDSEAALASPAPGADLLERVKLLEALLREAKAAVVDASLLNRPRAIGINWHVLVDRIDAVLDVPAKGD